MTAYERTKMSITNDQGEVYAILSGPYTPHTPIPRRHDCEVLYRHDHGFFAVCDICGPVGQPQARHTDAAAIAVRHFEQGGFEGRA